MKLERQMALLRAFLRQLPQEKAQALIAFLPEHDREVMLAGPAYNCHPLKSAMDMETLFGDIHPAWWIEKFSSLSSKDRMLTIAALPDGQRQVVAAHFGDTGTLPQLKGTTRRFLYAHLYYLLTEGNFSILPPSCSEEHPLEKLLSLSHEKLNTFIDRLGLYDLSSELKKVIRSAHIQEIEAMFSSNDLKFLASIRNQRDELKFGEIGINRWDGNQDELRTILHKRGINRLAKAFYSADEMLMWHLKHRLSPEDGALLEDLKTKTNDQKVYDILVKQMHATLETL